MDLLQKGWECPKCGAVMSPTTKVCVNCRGKTQSVSNIPNISNNSIDRPHRPCEEQNSIGGVRDPRLYN
jgi:hypothetical protein